MSTGEKVAALARVETLAGHKREALAEMGIPRSTYYRWRQKQRHQGLRELAHPPATKKCPVPECPIIAD